MKTPRMKKMLANGWRPPVFYGKFHPCATLTPEMVFEIRRLLNDGNLSVPKIAAIFGVGESAINHLRHGVTWRHIPVEKTAPCRSLTRSGMNKAAAKLKDTDIPKIRTMLLAGNTITGIAQQYGVSRMVIRGIRDKKYWSHVK